MREVSLSGFPRLQVWIKKQTGVKGKAKGERQVRGREECGKEENERVNEETEMSSKREVKEKTETRSKRRGSRQE